MAVQNNNLLTDDVIAKEALRLLKNNLVTAKLVYRNYEKTFGKVGDTIRLKLPYRVKAADGRTLVKQPMVDQTIPFKIDKQHHVGLEYTVKDKTLDIMDFSERYLKSGMIQIANKIDRNILLTLKKAFHTSGTPGVRPGKFIDFANAGAKQTTYAVPQDGMRHAVLDPFT
ncbi:P22 phage major capsid protein family protein, partial [Staphylococcus aureus]